MSSSPGPTLGEATRVWLRVGLIGFGGPAGQIAILHQEVVTERRWVSEDRFLHALNFCTLLPGPEAQQLATYLGWLLHGARGALIAGTLFVLPGVVILLGLSALYATVGTVGPVAAVFAGIKPAVLAIVVDALRRIGGRALQGRGHWVIAVAAFVSLFGLAVPFPIVVLVAGLIGWWMPVGSEVSAVAPTEPPSSARTIGVLATGLIVWWLPIALVAAALGPHHLFVTLGVFFSKAAVVTFGGAYSVLSYVSQEAVTGYGWLSAPEMLDGLALAETTPGPLILVLQFVGFLAGYRLGAPVAGLMGGLAGSLITMWATFVPSITLVLVGAPYVERLRHYRPLRGALSAITAAVVGVIANLAVWFAIHVVFGRVDRIEAGPLHLSVPVWSTVDPFSLALAVVAMVAMLRYRIGMMTVLAGAAGAGLLRWFLMG